MTNTTVPLANNVGANQDAAFAVVLGFFTVVRKWNIALV